MTTLAEIVGSLGGLATKRQLVLRGARDHHLTAAVRDGSVRRVRNGWYSTWLESDPRFRAVRVGGRLTGLAAIETMGGWVRERSATLHVSLPQNAARLRRHNVRKPFDYERRGGVELHWEGHELSSRGEPAIVALRDILIRVALDEILEDAVAAFDWALHTGRIEMVDVERIVRELPVAKRFIADCVDPECESLPESLARTRMRIRGWRVGSQVPVGPPSPTTGRRQRGDVLVEGNVVLEVDGKETHLETFEKDRSKDLDIAIDRYHSIRPAARHVFDEWPRVELAIERALAARGVVPTGNSGLAVRARRHFGRKPGPFSRRRARSPEFPKPRRE